MYKYNDRIVITGIGLTSPIGNNLQEMRHSLLTGKSGLIHHEHRHIGKVVLGLCDFPERMYQSRKDRRRGTRAGSIAIYCANEAIKDAGIDLNDSRWGEEAENVGVYLGITEHGNVETENEIHELYQNNLDVGLWSHHHNPRTVANSPAGEVTLNLKISGPHYTIGAACAAGNMGLIEGANMLRLGEVDLALAGGVSESAQTFGIFAAFKSQGALGWHEDPTLASRPLDKNRNGIAVAEGGGVYTLERLSDALKRGAKIYGEIVGHHSNSDASDYVLPNINRQYLCMKKALKMANLTPEQVDVISLHATGTMSGDYHECEAVNKLFRDCPAKINCSKGFYGHAMGAAGILELSGNLPSFDDGLVHACRNIDELDPRCSLPNLVQKTPVEKDVQVILNNSFGMLGINSVVIIKKYNGQD